MKYSKEERLEIGRQVYTGGLSKYEAGEKYGISPGTAREYMRLYRDTYNLPSKRGSVKGSAESCPNIATFQKVGLEEYESMTREQLVHELVMARINEARLKKGYEVKGDGAVILYGKENIK